jgi:hypothetical protein
VHKTEENKFWRVDLSLIENQIKHNLSLNQQSKRFLVNLRVLRILISEKEAKNKLNMHRQMQVT